MLTPQEYIQKLFILTSERTRKSGPLDASALKDIEELSGIMADVLQELGLCIVPVSADTSLVRITDND